LAIANIIRVRSGRNGATQLISGLDWNEALFAAVRGAQEAPMRRINCLRIAIGVALAGSIAGCQTESRNIPLMTIRQANQLPASQVPRIFRDPSNPYGYPYDVHETDGLSRNPDDCNRWGCVDTGGSK
jgi:hypothetical protein